VYFKIIIKKISFSRKILQNKDLIARLFAKQKRKRNGQRQAILDFKIYIVFSNFMLFI